MFAAERQSQIIKQLRENDAVSVQDLAKTFQITEMTVRRDLSALEKQGLITRSHGGAMIKNDKVGFESYFASRQHENNSIKRKIAEKAASLVTNGDCIGIDVGTTAYELTRYLKSIKDLNIITASLPVLEELGRTASDNGMKVICTGGELSHKDLSFKGHHAIRTIEEYILDIMFLGVAGISFQRGFTCYNMQDVLVKRCFIQQAREIIVVADSEKIGAERHAFLCGIEAASKIITDSRISDEDRRRFEDLGVEVITVDCDDTKEE